MPRSKVVIGLQDGSAIRSHKFSRAEFVALLVDMESVTTVEERRALAKRHGISDSFICQTWDRVGDAGGVAGYEINLHFRPGRIRMAEAA